MEELRWVGVRSQLRVSPLLSRYIYISTLDISTYLLIYPPPARVAAHQRRHFRRSILSPPDWRSGFCHVALISKVPSLN